MNAPMSLGCASAIEARRQGRGVFLHTLEWRAPGRPALCLLHGGSAHAHWFDAITPALVGRFDMVALDQRGHGESAWASPPAYATEDFVADLLSLMPALGWERMTVIGHSMGGHNAMALAAWHPERVSALVVVDARPAIAADRLHLMHARGRRAPRLHPSAEAAVHAFRLLPRETVAEPALLAHLARVGVVDAPGGWKYRFDPACNGARRPADLWPLLPTISAPTLIVRAARSPVLIPEAAARMSREIPRARLVEIPDAYHHLVLDRPHEFTRCLQVFLAETLGPSARVE